MMRVGLDVQTLETPERARGIGKLAIRTAELLAGEAVAGRLRLTLCGLGADAPPSVARLLGPDVGYTAIQTDGDPREHLRHGCASPFLWTTPGLGDLDVYHVTSPLMFDILMPTAGPCPVVATLLDAIPAVFAARGEPLFDEAGTHAYAQRVAVLKSYQGFLPISESAAADCAQHLVLNRAAMTTTYVPIDPRPPRPDAEERAAVLAKFGLETGFVVTVSGYHPRKNLAGTLAAFARLPDDLRAKHPLVLVCGLNADERNHVNDMAEGAGVAGQFIATGYVTDRELSALVTEAGCMVFASRYEGFGIPPAESLALGTPVVAACNSSLPEVLGDGGLLTADDDPAAMADAVGAVLSDADLRGRLQAAGFGHVRRFAPEVYLDAVLRGYRRSARTANATPAVSVSPGGHEGPRPLRIAMFSPLPPTPTGVADYTANLLRHLPDDIEVDCFVAESGGAGGDSTIPGGGGRLLAVHPHTDFRRSEQGATSGSGAARYDLSIYHIANNTAHEYILHHAETRPGLVVMHDHGLLGLARELARGHGRRHAMRRWYEAQHPEADGAVWDDDPALDALCHTSVTMTRNLLRHSRAVVAHSYWLADRLAEPAREKEARQGESGGPDVRVIPLGIDLAAADCPRPDRAALRRRWNVPPDAFTLVSIGVINRAKRVLEALKAFRDAAADGAEWRFLLVGPADPTVLREAMAFVDRHGLRDQVRFLGRRPADELHDIVSLADIGVNLRHPTMGESSAALMNLLACGCPALVTAEGQFLEYPDDVCWKVDAGGGERRQLVEMMRTLRERPEVLAAMGRAARHFAEARAWPVAGQAYGDLIRELAMARDGAAEYRPPVVLGR